MCDVAQWREHGVMRNGIETKLCASRSEGGDNSSEIVTDKNETSDGGELLHSSAQSGLSISGDSVGLIEDDDFERGARVL